MSTVHIDAHQRNGYSPLTPVLFHVILMSILFEHYKQLGKIVNERICSMGRKLGK